MELIYQEKIFRQKISEVESVINRQIRLPEQVFYKQFTKFAVIDFDEIFSEFFFQNIKKILKEESKYKFTFAVLENDPEEFFFKYCKKYPIFEVTNNDNYEDYLSITRDKLECIPNESLADNAYILTIYPEFLEWVVYGDFNFELGIIGFVNEKVMKNFVSIYGNTRIFTIEEAITDLLSVIYRNNIVPEDIRIHLINNYGN